MPRWEAPKVDSPPKTNNPFPRRVKREGAPLAGAASKSPKAPRVEQETKEEEVDDETCAGVKQEECPEDGGDGQQSEVPLKGINTLDVDSILTSLRSGQISGMAEIMRPQIGCDLFQLPPMVAVNIFHGLYFAMSFEDCGFYFAEICRRGWFVATLFSPNFNNRSFRGDWRHTVLEAQCSACEAFRSDREVMEISHCLPPAVEKIRKRFRLDKRHRKALRERGLEPSLVQREIVAAVYMGFQDIGCRTALWDGLA
ncbi:unnamed protein product [Symbiodinium sp. CCMP2592]|nr:unnamed protein product [Symbiodinium sp. CCMP2592]